MIDNWNAKSVNQEQLILEWRDHPVEAARDILGVELDRHQKLVLNSRWQHTTEYDVLSRGCGKTFLGAVTGVLRCILYPGHRVGFIGPSFRQSKMIFAEVEKLWEKSHVFQQCVHDHPKKSPESCYIKFSSAPGRSGSWLEALPIGTDGGKIRGARFYDVYADELAQMDNDVLNVVVRGFLATSANPMERVSFIADQRAKIAAGLMTEDQLVLPENNKFIGSSTAYYQYNHLWTRVQTVIDEVTSTVKKYCIENRDANGNNVDRETALRRLPHIKLLGGSLNEGQLPHRIISNGRKAVTAFTYHDPSEGFMNLETIKESRAEMSDYQFRMEYEAYFPPDSEGFYRRSLLDAARRHGEFCCQLGPRNGMLYTMGIDPARSNDNFAISIFEVDTITRRINLVRVLTWNKKNFPEMHQNVRKLIKLYGIEYFEMDGQGGGTTIRDLLASKESLPPGERLILERELEEHKILIGDRILGKLIQFSSGNWVHDANHNLLSGLQHGRLRIAALPENVPNIIWTPELEEADIELESALVEISSIVTSQAGDRIHWDTPTKTQRKDRYSSILIGYNAALKILGDSAGGKKLAMGGWG